MSWVQDHQNCSYSWHQSHDQATVLLEIPYATEDEDLNVVIERSCLIAGVRGQPPVVKGRLYGFVDTAASAWQLEPRTSRLSARERTTSTTSTTSTHSSYAFVSEPEISSSFAASLESGPTSDSEDPATPSTGFSSPVSTSADERAGYAVLRRRRRHASSQGASPPTASLSLASSYSSMESLGASRAGRLLTIHLEKAEPIIWPSLIVGPVPCVLSPCPPSPVGIGVHAEQMYNMDPTSLVLMALDQLYIRQDKEEAFEYFLRAWSQSHLPSAAIRLVTHYVPLHATSASTTSNAPEGVSPDERTVYYTRSLGGSSGLAQLYLEAGLLHLEGAASILLSTSYSPLSSIRLPPVPPYATDTVRGGTDAWKNDRDVARRYFERARTLCSSLEVPLLPPEGEDPPPDFSKETIQLQMPVIEVVPSQDSTRTSRSQRRRQRQKEEDVEIYDEAATSDGLDSTWYLYIPGLVGAGTALLVVGVVGALSLSSWRKSQN
ncbi:hypothetical protein DENSPDRAFT_832528 [Dentipellis sp. KUC8613]|nr:hypothetical protein DENSPDRAFT_832528 [Dentipellis sp. KUC8613]